MYKNQEPQEPFRERVPGPPKAFVKVVSLESTNTGEVVPITRHCNKTPPCGAGPPKAFVKVSK